MKIWKSLLVWWFVVFLSFSLMEVSFAKYFSDVADDSEYAVEIRNLVDLNVLNGYEDGTFKPDNEINRAEFIKIVIQAKFPGQSSGSNCFKDIKDEWFAPYVCFAKDKKVVGGYPDNTFRPDKPINFVEASKIIATAFALKIDDKYIETWFEKYVVALENAAAIPKSILHFDQKINRREMAFMAYHAGSPSDYYTGFTYANIRTISQLGPNVKRLPIDRFYSSNGKVYAVEFGKSYLLEGSDADSFQNIGNYYKDKNNIYFIMLGSLANTKILVYDDFDTESFDVVSLTNIGCFVKDKNGLYFGLDCYSLSDFTKIDYFKVDDFKAIINLADVFLFSDKKNLYMGKYFKSYDIDKEGVLINRLDSVDLASFELLKNTFNDVTVIEYFKDKSKVYYIFGDEFLSEVSGVDAKTLKLIQANVDMIKSNNVFVEEQYFKDKNGVYFAKDGKMIKIDGAEKETFEIVVVFDDSYHFSPEYSGYYLRDKNNIWVLNPEKIVDKLDEVSPTGFDYEKYLQDKNVEYWRELGG